MEVRLQNKQGLKDGIYYVFSTTQSPFRKGDFGEVYLGYKVVEQAGKKSPVAIEVVKGIYSNRVAYHHFLIDGYYHHSYCHDNLLEKLDIIIYNNEDVCIVTDFPRGVVLSDIFEGNTTDGEGVDVPLAIEMISEYEHNAEGFAVSIALGVLAGLATLHNNYMLHGRICPSNILLTEEGQVKLLDFFMDSTFFPKELIAGVQLSLPSLDYENIGYYSKEYVQAQARHDPSCDTYSVGMLLYRCITGHLPYKGDRRERLLSTIQGKLQLDEVPSKDIRKVIAKACNQHLNRRFLSATQMAESLRDIDFRLNRVFHNGYLFNHRYGLITPLCPARFSEIWQAFDYRSNTEVTIKIFAPPCSLVEEKNSIFQQHFASLSLLTHDNLITPTLIGVWENMLYLVFNPTRKGTIYNCLESHKRIGEIECWHLLNDMVSALSYLHGEGLAAFDLVNPSNIFLDNGGHYRLSCWTLKPGLAMRPLPSFLLQEDLDMYIAPEAFKRSAKAAIESEIWSLGAIVYELMEGRKPFGETGGRQQLYKENIVPIINGKYSHELRELVLCCLSLNPLLRPKSEDIQEIARRQIAQLDKEAQSCALPSSGGPQKISLFLRSCINNFLRIVRK